MKKGMIICLFFSAFSAIYAQNTIEAIVNECISVLGNGVPNGFQRVDRTKYKKDTELGTIVLFTENGQVFMSMITIAYLTTNAASSWNSRFYDFLEQSGVFYDSINFGDIYKKNNAYICIGKLSRRDDGLIATNIVLLKNVNYFYY